MVNSRLLCRLAGIVVLGIVVTVAQADEKLPLLRAGSESFTNVVITRKTATDLFILHDGGMATVKIKTLDEATRTRLGLLKEVILAPPLDGSSPEFQLGMKVQEAEITNRHAVILQAFDLDALYSRFVPTLPTSDAIRQQVQALPREARFRKELLADAVGSLPQDHLRFLGVRQVGNDFELLFRTWGYYDDSAPGYTGYVTRRQPDGSVRLADVHRFGVGELLSQALRRETFLELSRKSLLVAPLNAADQAVVSGAEAWKLFATRCDYGHFNLIKAAYDQLPPDLQNDRAALFACASCGEKSITDLMAPIERWRRNYPNDPCPDIMVVGFYERLYAGPRYVETAKGGRIETFSSWTPKEEEDATVAFQRANLWLADPMLEIRLARHYVEGQPEKARPLLQQALKRFPIEEAAMAELLKVDLATSNFVEVAETLHLKETTLHTNLTALVNSTPAYAAFRKSFSWKKWQYDFHGGDSKALTAPIASSQAAK